MGVGGTAPLRQMSDSDRGQALAASAPRSKHGVSSDLANRQAGEATKQKWSRRRSGCRIGTRARLWASSAAVGRDLDALVPERIKSRRRRCSRCAADATRLGASKIGRLDPSASAAVFADRRRTSKPLGQLTSAIAAERHAGCDPSCLCCSSSRSDSPRVSGRGARITRRRRRRRPSRCSLLHRQCRRRELVFR
jgi:hypothetical protein